MLVNQGIMGGKIMEGHVRLGKLMEDDGGMKGHGRSLMVIKGHQRSWMVMEGNGR